MNIDRYIKELIRLSECVILPGFGGFVTRYRSARYDSHCRLLSPPSKEVRFRNDLTRDNGVLVEYIAKHERIRSRKARIIIEKYVADKIQQIEGKGETEIPGIGVFRYGSDGKIDFLPDEKENFLVDSYGLEEIEVSNMPESENGPGTNAGPVQSIDTLKRKNTGLWIAAGILMILGLGLLLVLMNRNYSDENENTFLSFDLLPGKNKQDDSYVFGKQRIIEPDSMQKEISGHIDRGTDKKNALFYDAGSQDTSEIQEDLPVMENPSCSIVYHIVAGSFKSLRNAERLESRLNAEGYKSKIVNSNTYYMVVLDSFVEKNKAIDEMRRIRNSIDQSVWILSL